MRILHRIYYAFNRWRYGVNYGCGRCHHAVWFHIGHGQCNHGNCPCREYHIGRVAE
jgi:hypothetical protein